MDFMNQDIILFFDQHQIAWMEQAYMFSEKK